MAVSRDGAAWASGSGFWPTTPPSISCSACAVAMSVSVPGGSSPQMHFSAADCVAGGLLSAEFNVGVTSLRRYEESRSHGGCYAAGFCVAGSGGGGGRGARPCLAVRGDAAGAEMGPSCSSRFCTPLSAAAAASAAGELVGAAGGREDAAEPADLDGADLDVLVDDAEEFRVHGAELSDVAVAAGVFRSRPTRGLAVYALWGDRIAEDLRHEVSTW